MCAGCEDWMYATTLRYMAQTGVHLEIALRLTRDTVVQNAVVDQESEKKSDEVTMQTIRALSQACTKVAERMRDMNPGAIAALVSMIDTST